MVSRCSLTIVPVRLENIYELRQTRYAVLLWRRPDVRSIEALAAALRLVRASSLSASLPPGAQVGAGRYVGTVVLEQSGLRHRGAAGQSSDRRQRLTALQSCSKRPGSSLCGSAASDECSFRRAAAVSAAHAKQHAASPLAYTVSADHRHGEGPLQAAMFCRAWREPEQPAVLQSDRPRRARSFRRTSAPGWEELLTAAPCLCLPHWRLMHPSNRPRPRRRLSAPGRTSILERMGRLSSSGPPRAAAGSVDRQATSTNRSPLSAPPTPSTHRPPSAPTMPPTSLDTVPAHWDLRARPMDTAGASTRAPRVPEPARAISSPSPAHLHRSVRPVAHRFHAPTASSESAAAQRRTRGCVALRARRGATRRADTRDAAALRGAGSPTT